MNRRRNARCQDFLAPKYSGQWWASNLIKQIISYSLNEWQIRNNKLQAEITENQYNTESTTDRTHLSANRSSFIPKIITRETSGN
jgi:hypothetical protein